MDALTVCLPPELRGRLERVSARAGKTPEESLTLAVLEFVEHWERHLDDMQILNGNEIRALLKIVSE